MGGIGIGGIPGIGGLEGMVEEVAVEAATPVPLPTAAGGAPVFGNGANSRLGGRTVEVADGNEARSCDAKSRSAGVPCRSPFESFFNAYDTLIGRFARYCPFIAETVAIQPEHEVVSCLECTCEKREGEEREGAHTFDRNIRGFKCIETNESETT
jgi:hypothetical protein